MFTRPKNGWTEIHLEDFEGLGSYIQDIPVMVLDRGVQSVQERTPLKLWFDEEESVFTLTADEETKIVTEGEFGAEEYNIKCSKLDLIREIKNDKIVSLVLGAGLSRRMAGFTDDKLSLPWKSGTILGETIANVRRTTGMNPAVVTQEGRKTPGAAFTAVNPDPRRGQGSSLGIGINKIASVCPDAAGVLVYLGDQPEISRETASRVLREVLEHPGSIVIPEHNEKPGHPVFFPAAFFNELSELDGEEAGKSVLRSNPDKVRRIACGPDCTRDIDTPEAYRRLMEEQQMEEFKRSSEKKSRNPLS